MKTLMHTRWQTAGTAKASVPAPVYARFVCVSRSIAAGCRNPELLCDPAPPGP